MASSICFRAAGAVLETHTLGAHCALHDSALAEVFPSAPGCNLGHLPRTSQSGEHGFHLLLKSWKRQAPKSATRDVQHEQGRKGGFLCRGMFSPILQVAKPGRERRRTQLQNCTDRELESLLETEADCPAIKQGANSKCPVLAAACFCW